VLAGAIDKFLSRMKEEDPSDLARLRNQIRRQVPLLARPFFMASLLKTLLPGGAIPSRAARGPVPETGRPSRTGASTAEAARAPRAGVPPEAPKAPRGRFGRSIEASPAVGRPARGAESARTQFTQLFVSIGRNRRVYARDLTALFTESLQLAAGEIGDVRVFEKYSFVDIAPSRAGEAITKLSGSELKGRTITVNYAKKKEEKEER
jgi:hypothetical protein